MTPPTSSPPRTTLRTTICTLGALTPPTLSCLLLAAHYLRSGDLGMVAVCLALPGLFFLRRAWVRPVLQAAFAAGMAVWVLAMMDLIQFRQVVGLPWLRLALILGSVAVVTGAGALFLETRVLRERFSRRPEAALVQSGAFLLTVCALALAQAKVSFPILLGDRFFPGFGALQILGMGLYAAWIAGKLTNPERAPLARARMWLFFSVIFFGQLALGLAGWERFLMTGDLHLPVPALILAGPIYRGEGFFMLILFLSTVLLVGPAWCSHLCYIGAWDHQAALRTKRPQTLPSWAFPARLAIFALIMLTALGLRLLDVHWTWAVALAAGFGLAGVGIMAAISRKMGVMAHCTVFCPVGLAAVVLGRLLPWRLRINQDCDACGRCARVCRYGALEPGHLANRKPGLSCTLCGDCIHRCRDNRLSYGFARLSPTTSRHLFILLITVLHAVFLATARI
ncbi:4Fe-4S binding protein [Desulfonatronum sp. SC1]|uniref:4Fe-4S binding protein n=1 Tax=Desulfonatronum sp. SC1 TaxID=2109626 RepID=UPI000D2F923F|nr:4Fe-4S binding protein [Desulfonatronum sp. SC1]PTN36550.1 4Fe-4S ferredoxin [Desulfonatronum sp. SC1]